jgi:flagellar biosynthesis/type III secretory pathway protein FliH
MGHVVKHFGRVVPAVVLDATQRAQVVVVQAEQRGRALLDDARAEAELIRENARKLGEAEGRAAAEAAFTSLTAGARAEAERIHADALPAARTLALRMAEKVIGHAADLQPAVMADIAARALAASRARAGVLKLRVHPEDLAALEAGRPTLAARLAKTVTLQLVADAAVGRYGCVVESPAGQFDARLETQLAALERAVFGDAAEIAPLPPLSAIPEAKPDV